MASNAPTAMELQQSGFFTPIVEQCEGCERVVETNNVKFCKTYAFPDAKWRLGICNFATHKKVEIAVSTIKVNPLKAAKRASGGKKK